MIIYLFSVETSVFFSSFVVPPLIKRDGLDLFSSTISYRQLTPLYSRVTDHAKQKTKPLVLLAACIARLIATVVARTTENTAPVVEYYVT
jgi:hypothetical protein